MIYQHPIHAPSRRRHWAALLLGTVVLSGCSLQGARGNAASVSSNQAAPPGGMGPGAVELLSPTPKAVATATSAPIVAVATVVQPPPTAAPPTATEVPVPPPVLAVPPLPTAPAARRTTPTTVPTRRATERPTTSATPGRTATPTATPHLVTYVVKRGDDVYSIARRFSVTPALIISANDLKNPSKIKIGQVLHIPVVGSHTPAT